MSKCVLRLVAVIVAVPMETAFTKPLDDTVATASLLEVQVTPLLVALSGATFAVSAEEDPI